MMAGLLGILGRCRLLLAVCLCVLAATFSHGAGQEQACKSEGMKAWIEGLGQGGTTGRESREELRECGVGAIAPLRIKLVANDWQAKAENWALQEALIEVLTEIAGDLGEDGQALKTEELAAAIVEIEEGIGGLGKFQEAFRRKLPPVSNRQFDTPSLRAAYVEEKSAKLVAAREKLGRVLWWRKNQELILSSAAVAAALLFYGGVLWLRPLGLLRLPSAVELPFAVPFTKWKPKLPPKLMRWLKYRPRVLNQWVKKHLPPVREQFAGDAGEGLIDAEWLVLAEFSDRVVINWDGDLQRAFRETSCCMVVLGKGGEEGIRLTRQLAQQGMGSAGARPICQHPMLPIVIEHGLDEEAEGKDPLVETVRRQLRQSSKLILPTLGYLLEEDELIEQLLQKQRILVIARQVCDRTVGWLAYHPQALDLWVTFHLPKVRAEFEQKDTARDREVHIPLPAMLDGKLLVEPCGKDLQGIFDGRRFCMLIAGEGGAGKTSLACQIARWAMAENKEERLCSYRMLPVLIEQELPEVAEGKDQLLEAIRGQLNGQIDAKSPVAAELVEQLLRERRLLVIVDHFSEMTEATRKKINPQQPGFIVNALVVTSRLDEELGGTTKTRLQPLRVEGDRLSKFIDAYLGRLGKRDLLEDEDYFDACRQLTRLVGEREITVLLARMYAEQLLATLEGTASDLPENIPELMLSYLNRLNRSVEAGKRQEERRIHRDAQLVAWGCLQQTFQPAPAPLDLVEKLLQEADPEADPKQRLEYLKTDLRLLQAVEPDKIRFLLDPLAEYLAALQIVAENGDRPEVWQGFLDSIDAKSVALEKMQGFLLAVRGSCLVRQERGEEVPEFVEPTLVEKAGLDPEALKKAQQKQIIRLLISDLAVKEDRDRVLTAVERLRKSGADAKRAVPALGRLLRQGDEEIASRAIAALQAIGEVAVPVLAQALQAKRAELRQQAVQALAEIEGDLISVVPELVEALGDEESEVRKAAIAVLKRCGSRASAAVPSLIGILESQEEESLGRDAALALGAIGGEAALQALRRVLEDGDREKRIRLATLVALWQLGEHLPVSEEVIAPEMVQIPGGKFWMGSVEGEGDDDERPQHEVEVKLFRIGKYPVTQAEWREVATLLPQVKRELKPDPSEFKGDDRPVEQVSWHEAVEYCDRLTHFTGREYRLPTEAEWEYACRAGTTTAYHFGPDITPELANSGGNKQGTTPVGSYGANAFGLYDMHGNVWEWCADRWHENYEGAPTDGSAWLEGGEDRYLLRGGSWDLNPRNCRSANRNWVDPGSRDLNIGFRVVCVAPRT